MTDVTADPGPATVEDAQALVDEHWTAHEAVRGPLHDGLVALLGSLQGITGMDAGPGMERAITAFLDFAEAHAGQVVESADNKAAAHQAELQREALKVAAAPPVVDLPPPSQLTDMTADEARAWVQTANDADVTTELERIPLTVIRLEFAKQLYAWVRADGGLAQMLEALNLVISRAEGELERNAEEGVDLSTMTVDEVQAWVGSDDGRARVAYDAEADRAGGPRAEVLAFLVEILDHPLVSAVDPAAPAPDAGADAENTTGPPAEAPAPDAGNAEATADAPAPDAPAPDATTEAPPAQ